MPFHTSALQDDLQTLLSPGTAPLFWSLICLDRFINCRSARSCLGDWPEIYPRFYAFDAKHYHYCGNDRQYRHALWAMRTLPVGTAYAVWTGIGAVGAAITGILLLGESASPARLLSLGLIVAGIIGLKLSTH